jgi:hypothetical protein
MVEYKSSRDLEALLNKPTEFALGKANQSKTELDRLREVEKRKVAER